MRRRLFVARGAIDLAGEEQAANVARLETGRQGAWIEKVVLDRIARPQQVGVLQPHHRPNRFNLNVKRQRGRNAIRVDLVGRQALGLEKDLVRILVSESIHLVFDARAIARADAFDHPLEHRAAIEAATDDFMGARIGVGDPARHLPRMH